MDGLIMRGIATVIKKAALLYLIVVGATAANGQVNQSKQQLNTEPAVREMLIDKRYLHFPVKTGNPNRRVKLLIDGRLVREFSIELASGDADFVVTADIREWIGQMLTIKAGKFAGGNEALGGVEVSDILPSTDDLYAEKYRPQFHFTSRRGWLNDPNGLVYNDGQWHLFYQHNPYGWNWGNIHWGHAISADLIHWQELGEALHPWSDAKGMCFSGSALVDTANTSGLKTGKKDVLVAAFTDTGTGESIAYSNDQGKTWTMYESNPVLDHAGRDPRIFWHERTGSWVMAVYDEVGMNRSIAFHSSANLTDWKLESRIAGFFECPDIFQLPVDGDPSLTKWILYGADGQYLIGDFDGHSFTPDDKVKRKLWYGHFYAAQTYNNTPNDRRIQIGWARGIEFPGMPFNQQMTIPVELSLRTVENQIRMFALPVEEIRQLRDQTTELSNLLLSKGTERIDVRGELFDITAEFEMGDSELFGLRVGGQEISYDVSKEQVYCGFSAPLKPENGKITLRILIDRGSIEVFGNGGLVAISQGVLMPKDIGVIEIFAIGGEARVKKFVAHKLKSGWN